MQKKFSIKTQLSTSASVIFVLMVLMVVYSFISFYKTSVSNIETLGESNLAFETSQISNYLEKGLNVLWVTADTVENFLENGESAETINNYLLIETEHQKNEIDENFSGIYGFVKGTYVDGFGWVPPENFDPKSRDWYTVAKNAGGKVVIVPPYLDAKTNTIMISISKLLKDGESVVSLDVTLNQIQTMTESINMEGMGYGFIIDESGLVIAHFKENEKGKIYPTTVEEKIMMDGIINIPNGKFNMEINNEKCTVFTRSVMDTWHVVMVLSNTKLFKTVRNNMAVNGAFCLVVLAIILLFAYSAYEKILKHQKKDEESHSRLEKMNKSIIWALSYTIDAKDRYTSGHSHRVAKYAKEIARRMGKNEHEQNEIFYAGLLHDIGKIRVPEDLINKPGELNHNEYNKVQIHPIVGYYTVKDIFDNPLIANAVKYHHERFDGKGYPNRLSGKDIPEIARIICVADTYDAMASTRSYRDALPQNVVRLEIEQCSGAQFDPDISKIMLEMIDEDKNYDLCQHYDGAKNVLVVDNDDSSNSKIKNYLSDENLYRVFVAKDENEFTKIIGENRIDVILLDISILENSGFDAFEKIFSDGNIPIVFMSNNNDFQTLKKAELLKAADFLTKPLYHSILEETIYGVINTSR